MSEELVNEFTNRIAEKTELLAKEMGKHAMLKRVTERVGRDIAEIISEAAEDGEQEIVVPFATAIEWAGILGAEVTKVVSVEVTGSAQVRVPITMDDCNVIDELEIIYNGEGDCEESSISQA